MKKLLILLYLLVAFGILTVSFKNANKTYETQRIRTATYAEDEQRARKLFAERKQALRDFFEKFGSPWVGQEETFLVVSETWGIPWQLLPSVGCVESSCGKKFKRNAFGWSSDGIDCGSLEQDLACVAKGIATLGYYTKFRETGELADFAYAYNKPYWQEYLSKLRYFWNFIEEDGQ